ncbi:hypothetical protein CABS01_07360 [Colletotrichum abscissum]|uniref:Uncharacterized protein n=1 Tax=Colletotrichum abscissum TaxID=1671311 RepID=A0A9P9XS99_9PEZI|nr:uncharacterized protein CABS01_07360 [Colletotrichum abscissum]KAI3558673.1 hypothetical protein CABS02_01289 [Colletotrichum abscissum]KAK1511402.1 hypothetical protein CABS01_07360 [Colletotrichum abscissum]
MRFSLFFLSALVASCSAVAIPGEHSHEHDLVMDMSPVPRGVLDKRDSYDCKGSSLCSSLKVAACDDAVNNKLIRNNDVNYGAPGSGRPKTGACSNIFGGYGCGVFIQGKSGCARTGNQMWYDYQDIRANGCRVCGSKHWGDGCLTTINYVSGC